MQRYHTMDALLQAEFEDFDRLYVVPQPGGTNPYLTRLYAERLKRGGADAPVFLPASAVFKPWLRRVLGRERSVWSQHWLQFSTLPTFVRTNLRLLASALFAWSGGRILWTIHNERPHAGRYLALNHWYCQRLAKFVHRFHVHHEGAAAFVQRAYGASESQIVLLPHPPYEVARITRESARAGLASRYDIPLDGKKLLLMFGFITPYKGIEDVVAGVKEVNGPDSLLVIAGPVNKLDEDYARSLKASLKGPHVIVRDGYIPEDDVPLFMCAADAVVFNHTRSLTSGAMQLAADYECMIIAPDVDAVAAFPRERLRIFRSRAELTALLGQITAPPPQEA